MDKMAQHMVGYFARLVQLVLRDLLRLQGVLMTKDEYNKVVDSIFLKESMQLKRTVPVDIPDDKIEFYVKGYIDCFTDISKTMDGLVHG